MLKSIARKISEILGFYGATEDDLITHVLRFRYEKIPVKYRPWISAGLSVVKLMVERAPEGDEAEKKD